MTQEIHSVKTDTSEQKPTCKAVLVQRAIRKIFCGTLAFAFFATTAMPEVSAQSRRPSLVRDAEIESLIRDYSAPIFRAAGIKAGYVDIHIVNSRAFNAFVANGRRMFINTGTLMTAETPNEVIGVIAHETGHLAGGHLIRLRDALRSAQTVATVAAILGAGTAVAGAASGSREGAQAGSAIISGGNTIAQRALLSYQRTEELAADRAALKYLERTGQSARGMLTTFERFARSVPLAGRGRNPYLRSHPLPRERIGSLQTVAKRSKHFNKKDSKGLQFRHDMARAKLAAFTLGLARTDRLYPKSDKSLAAQYARAILAYRHGNPKRAIKQIDALIRKQPNNPYFWELKGQAYLETGNAAASIDPLRKAVRLAPNAAPIRILLGHALVATQNPKNLGEAIKTLERALQIDTGIATQGHRQLAIAYGRSGRIADAELTTADGYFLAGNYRTAKVHAARAQKRFKRGAPGWLRADDILKYKPPKLKRRRRG